jgi:hypothetical protein
MVRATGFEPAWVSHWNLNPARLPIPPRPHLLGFSALKTILSGIRQDDNT